MVLNSSRSGRQEYRCRAGKGDWQDLVVVLKTDLEDEFVVTQERKTVVYETF